MRPSSAVSIVCSWLRSGDRAMPEEINRVLTDQLSDWLYTSCIDATPNLLAGFERFVLNYKPRAHGLDCIRSRRDGLNGNGLNSSTARHMSRALNTVPPSRAMRRWILTPRCRQAHWMRPIWRQAEPLQRSMPS